MTRPTLIGRGGWPLTSTFGGGVDVPPGAEPAPSCCSTEPPPDRAVDEASVAEVPGESFGDVENLLLGITITGSNTGGGGPPSPSNPTNINDDSVATTSTVGAGVYGAGESYWSVDLGVATLVSSSELYIASGGPGGLSLEYSTDNVGWTEIVAAADWDPVNPHTASFTPTSARYWRLVFTQVGGYGGTNDIGEWRLYGQAVVSGGVWDPAPLTIDGDDATYETSDGTNVIRIDLGTAYRIVTTTVRIGTETAGSKTYTIWGTNNGDFSGVVLLDTLTWTALGSYGAQDVTASWVATESYRYFLITGPDETRRIYSWELYEATLATNHQHSLITLSDVSGTPNTADVLAYSSNTGLWQPRSTVHQVTSNTSNTLTNPFINLVSGSGIAFAAASNTLTISSTATGGASVSYGSNASHVAEISLVGIEAAVARADHYHAGVAQVTASSSNTLQQGTVNFRPGTGIALALTNTDGDAEFDTITITNTVAAGGGGSLTVADEGTPLATAATTLDFVGAGVTASGTGATKTITIAGGGAEDVISDLFGAADTAYEFETSSLTGLTALSPTPDVEDADTTIAGHYFVADNAAGVVVCGRYASVSPTFTAIAKLSSHNLKADYNTAGIFIGEATPGIILTVGPTRADRFFRIERFTNPTTYHSNPASRSIRVQCPVYLAIIVNSSTDVDTLWSEDGRVWEKIQDAYDPSMTVGSVGIYVKSENTTRTAAAFDFLRIWNSAKTFPGII